MDILFPILALSFLFGFFVDFADLLDEHGLVWFRGAPLVFGILGAIFGSLIIFLNVPASLYVSTLVLYWVIKQKLDFLNHAVMGSVILFCSIIFIPRSDLVTIALVAGFGTQALQGFIGTYIKNKFTLNSITKELIRLRHFVPPIAISLVVTDLTPLYVFVFFTIGLKLSEIWFNNFEKTGKSKIASVLGLSINEVNG